MLMIVFGAGASYDSNSTYQPNKFEKIEKRMPLSDELFENRELFNLQIRKYYQIRPILNFLRRVDGDSSLEQILQNLQNEADKYPNRPQQLAAVRYYIQSVIYKTENEWLQYVENVTNHITLFDELQPIEKEGICLVTFNYDTLIEKALQSLNVKIEQLDHYISDSKYKLYKLHGSVNWMHPVSGVSTGMGRPDVFAKSIIENISDAKIAYDNFNIVNPSLFDSPDVHPPYIPAIAIPIENKSQFECPDTHLESLKEMIPHVDRMLMIGWRATETHFLEMISDQLQPNLKCMVVTEEQDSSAQTAKNLKKYLKNFTFETSDYGFSHFVHTRKIKEFID